MALVIDIMHECSLSNKMQHQMQPKKSKLTLYYVAVDTAAKGLMRCTLLTRQKALVSKVRMQ